MVRTVVRGGVTARPGARREQLASYIKRLDDLEAICRRFSGVERAYALQAGREIRVMVMNDQVDDAQAIVMSKEIARAIETEATYPGQVRVVVVPLVLTCEVEWPNGS